jgi:hypothetical protein
MAETIVKKQRSLDLKTILILLGIFVAVMLLWNTPVVWPLKILVVFLHEISHGLMALITGGSIDHIEVVAEQGGLAFTRGGSAFLVSNAGYLGSLVFGALILVLAARTRLDRWILAALGLLLSLVAVIWVPFSNAFGFFFGLGTGVLLLAVAKWLPNSVSDYLLKIIGLTSCGYAILDIYSDTIARSEQRSDARMLAESTGIPTVVWGGLWILLGVAGAALALYLASKGEKPAAATAPAAPPPPAA